MAQDSTVFLAAALFVPYFLLIIGYWKKPAVLVVTFFAGRVLLDSVPLMRQPLLLGLSVLDLYSIFWMIVFLFSLVFNQDGKYLRYGLRGENALVIYLLVAMLVASFINANVVGFSNVATKWMFLWVCTGMLWLCLDVNPKFPALLLLPLTYPLANQLFLYLSGSSPKCTHELTMCSYIGSFEHESVLGAYLILGIVLTLMCLKTAASFAMRFFLLILLLLFHLGLYLNNYRTLLAALAVFWVAFIFSRFRSMNAHQRILFIYAFLLSGALIGYLALPQIKESFGDLIVFASAPLDYIKPTANGGGEEVKALMSGRVYLINIYLYKYLASSVSSWFFGIGLETGKSFAGVYAHNQYLGILVEGGIFVFCLFSAWLVAVWRLTWRVRNFGVPGTVSFSGYMGVLVLGLGTMPFENMRVIFLVSFLIAVARNAVEVQTNSSVSQAERMSKGKKPRGHEQS